MHDAAHFVGLCEAAGTSAAPDPLTSVLRACSSKWSASACIDVVPARVRAWSARRRHAAACLRRPSAPPGLSQNISVGGWTSNAGSIVVSGSARVSLSRTNAYNRIAARYVLVTASSEIRELKFSPLFRARRHMPPYRTVETTVQIRGVRRSDVGKPVWAGSS